MFNSIKVFFFGLGSGIIALLSIFFFFLSKKSEDYKGKGNRLKEKGKNMERKKDSMASEKALRDIEKTIKKKKEKLNENSIHDLTRKFNDTFNR